MISENKLPEGVWGATYSALVCCDSLLEFSSQSNDFVLLLLRPGVFVQGLGAKETKNIIFCKPRAKPWLINNQK